ncbi:MAG: hypothetical protein AAF590_10585 [Pseudomonadota bacterium]
MEAVHISIVADIIAATAAVVAAIATVSLLYVIYRQLKATNQSIQETAVQSLTQSIATINSIPINNPEVGEALATVCEDWYGAKREQRISAHYFLFSWFKLGEQAWSHSDPEQTDASTWDAWSITLIRYYHSPGIRDGWWKYRKNAFSPEFVEEIETSDLPDGVEAHDFHDVFGSPKHPVVRFRPKR